MLLSSQSRDAFVDLRSQTGTHGRTSYVQILRSSAIIGGSSVVTVVLGIIRTKVMAVFLGPSGIGLVGIFDSIIQLARTLACLGIDSSGVRQVAEAHGTGDIRRVSVSVICLRKACLLLGLIGSVGLYALRYRVSKWSFGDQTHAEAIGWLSLAVFLSVVSAGQSSLLQGFRKIWGIAFIKIASAVCALLFSVPIIYFWGARGIVGYLLVVYVSTVFSSWWLARQIDVLRCASPWREQFAQFRCMAKWGGVFLATGSITTFVSYATRALVSRYIGLDATGQFQAAFALSSIYVGFILAAMGTDFYPMLTAKASDNRLCNRLVNEQISVSLLAGIPGIVCTLMFAEPIVKILYSGKFSLAAEILYWQMPGVFLRVAIWPLGIALAAKGCSRSFLISAVLGGVVEVVLFQMIARSGSVGFLGVAGTVALIVNFPVTTFLLRRASGFSWSGFNSRLVMFGLLAISGGLGINLMLTDAPRVLAGLGLLACCFWYSVRRTVVLTGYRDGTSLFKALVVRVRRRIGWE
jgi:enterobacterial common antigen flippase